MAFGIYVHVPYCLQRCSYCDFATYEQKSILPIADYFTVLHQEVDQRQAMIADRTIKSVYFGGGTPSLAPPSFIIALLDKFSKLGFTFAPNAEITIEINPATLDQDRLQQLIAGGVNRFSVGAQTFNDRLLKLAGRRHCANDTIKTLDLLRAQPTNYTLDLLFALPTQRLSDLVCDLEQITQIAPPHVSAYCLTVPNKHPMNAGRPREPVQLKMFALIEEYLARIGLQRYEISNFSRPGYESRHNLIYWQNESFWGIGLSAHSYLPSAPWGVRFWNPSEVGAYVKQIRDGQIRLSEDNSRPQSNYPEDQFEDLALHQALTDFCHMRLRTMRGLEKNALCSMFPSVAAEEVQYRLARMVERGWLETIDSSWRLSAEGLLVSNQVFLELTFLRDDLCTESGWTNSIPNPIPRPSS